MTIGRVSQAAVEALLQSTPKARVTGTAAESILQATPRARHGQQAVEVLRSLALAGGGLSRPSILILSIDG